MTLSDLEWLSKISMTRSVARSLCDSWVSCFFIRHTVGHLATDYCVTDYYDSGFMQWRIQACRFGGGATLTPSPLFPLLFPSPPLAFLFSSPPYFLFPPIQLGGLGQRCKLPQWGPGRSLGRRCIFSIFWGTETFLAVSVLLLSVQTKCQWKLKNAHIKLILPNCYSSEEVRHEAVNPLIVKPFIYRTAPIFINSQSTI